MLPKDTYLLRNLIAIAARDIAHLHATVAPKESAATPSEHFTRDGDNLIMATVQTFREALTAF